MVATNSSCELNAFFAGANGGWATARESFRFYREQGYPCKITGYNDFEHTMDTSNPVKKDDHLLDDLESIRQLLGDDGLQPPLLTEPVDGEVQIPLLFDMVGGKSAPAPVELPS